MPALVAVYQDVRGRRGTSRGRTARASLHARGRLETTFKEETETDLFASRRLCAAVSRNLIKAAFETLCEAG